MRRSTKRLAGKYAVRDCWSKPAYATEAEALITAKHAAGGGAVTSKPYPCRVGDHYHLTTKGGR